MPSALSPARSEPLVGRNSPLRAFLTTMVGIFVAELVSMWAFENSHTNLPASYVIADSAVLLALTAPVVYFLLYRPLMRQIRKRALAERALVKARDELEERVVRRTAELKAANEQLVREMEERRLADEALRYSEEKYSTLVENSATGIFVVQDGAMSYVNPKIAQMMEYSREELMGIDPAILVHPEDRECVLEIKRKRMAGEDAPEEYECRLVTKTGQKRWVSMRNRRVPYRGDQVTLGNVLDVTERKEMESALRAKSEALRSMSKRILTVQEEERRRLAREIHDSLGQTLSAVKFAIEAALSGAWPDVCSPQREGLRSTVAKVQGAITEVRRISMALRPSTLDDLGLLPTVTWYLREFKTTYTNLAVQTALDVPESAIPEELKTPIFRILQEATNNAAKHSGAACLKVSLQREGPVLRLSVQDDGVGFDSASVPGNGPGGGLGLVSMRERAELSGGAFSLRSAPGAGTAVEAAWRLEQEAVSG